MVSGVVHHHLDHCSIHCCLDCLTKVDWRRGGCKHQTAFHSLLTKCFSLKSKSQSANWNRWMKLSTYSRSSCLTTSRSDWQPSSLNLLKNASLNTFMFVFSWSPKVRNQCLTKSVALYGKCPGPVYLSANTDWRTPWMSSTIGGAMSVYCMLVAVNNGIVCWHCIRHIDIWSSAGLIRNISHFD